MSVDGVSLAIDTRPELPRGEVVHRVLADVPNQDYFVYRARAAGPDAPVFVAVHDISRDAREQIGAFAAEAERRGAIAVAPRFSIDRFPNYQRLGRSRDGATGGHRADEALDAILDEVASLVGRSDPGRIHLFGYAAGARFAIRYAMVRPERVAAVVAASAGAYTFPDPSKRFPRGIDPGDGRSGLVFDPQRFLRVPITLFEADDAVVSKRRLRRVGRAGTRRNGRNWVAAMNAAAERYEIEPVCALYELDIPDHSFRTFLTPEQPRVIFDALMGPCAEDGSTEAREARRSRLGFFLGTPGETSVERRARIRRNVVCGVLAVAFLAFAAPVALWLHYRSTHIMAQHAVLRGHIAEVGARLDGVIASVEVDAGDRVKAGAVIARLHDAQLQARVRQAKSQLAKAERELEVERLAIENERAKFAGQLRGVSADSSAAGAELSAARSLAEEARRRRDLQRNLAKKGLVAEEQVRIAETEYRTAAARVSAATAEQSSSEAARELAEVEIEGVSVRQRRVSVLEAEVEAYAAELALAEANLAGSVIRAPDDGAVIRRIVEPGTATVVGQPLVSLWVGENVWVEAWIDEADLGDLSVGSPAVVTLNSYPDREFTGAVETISVSTDFELPDEEVLQPRSERMRDAPVIAVRIRLDETGDVLFPGLSASVGIRKRAD